MVRLLDRRISSSCESGACSSTNNPSQSNGEGGSQQNGQQSNQESGVASSAAQTEWQVSSMYPSATSSFLTSTPTSSASPTATATVDGASGLSNLQIGIIIGAVVGLAILLSACFAFCDVRRRRRKSAATTRVQQNIRKPEGISAESLPFVANMNNLAPHVISSPIHSPSVSSYSPYTRTMQAYQTAPTPPPTGPLPPIGTSRLLRLPTYEQSQESIRMSVRQAQRFTPTSDRTMNSLRSTVGTSILEDSGGMSGRSTQSSHRHLPLERNNITGRPYISSPISVESTALGPDYMSIPQSRFAASPQASLPRSLTAPTRNITTTIVQPAPLRPTGNAPRTVLEAQAHDILLAQENAIFAQENNLPLQPNGYLGPGPVSYTSRGPRYNLGNGGWRTAGLVNTNNGSNRINETEIGVAVSPTSIYSFTDRETMMGTMRSEGWNSAWNSTIRTQASARASSCLLPWQEETVPTVHP